MLATSNVPVWAAEFSDGTDTPISTEAPAAEAFSDDATEAPVVEDGTVENATATTSKLAPLVMDEKVNVKSTTSSAEVWTGSLGKKTGQCFTCSNTTRCKIYSVYSPGSSHSYRYR